MDTDKKVNNSFTKLNHEWWDYLLVLDVNLRQLKLIYLVLRLTYGIKEDSSHADWAVLKLADLQSIGISPSHAREVLQKTLGSGVLSQKQSEGFQINLNKVKQVVENDKKLTARLARLRHVIRKNITKNFPY